MIYASEKCAEHLKHLDDATISKFFSGKAEPIIVDRIIKNKDTITTGKYSFEVIETPGHTDCSICLYDKKNGVLFSGDTIFHNDKHGVIDFPTGNYAAIKKSIQKLKKLKFKELFPGHIY